MNKIGVFSLFIFATFFPFAGQAQANKIEEISPTHAQAMVENGAAFIDVREKKEVLDMAYDAEHVLNIPYE